MMIAAHRFLATQLIISLRISILAQQFFWRYQVCCANCRKHDTTKGLIAANNGHAISGGKLADTRHELFVSRRQFNSTQSRSLLLLRQLLYTTIIAALTLTCYLFCGLSQPTTQEVTEKNCLVIMGNHWNGRKEV
ncbi:hypothetical protein J6590_007411 [Homalodisca vitripennis]|nr:hypothetical protein J6590_007411 [Homalodisca vitripennis]